MTNGYGHIKKCLKYAFGIKDITGNIYTCYVDQISGSVVFQWYDSFARHLYRITLEKSSMDRAMLTKRSDTQDLIASLMEIHPRKGDEESDMKFPVVGPSEFIFPIEEDPVFSEARGIKKHLNSIFSFSFLPSVILEEELLTFNLTSKDSQSSLLPNIILIWSSDSAGKHYLENFRITFGSLTQKPQRQMRRVEDSSPLFSVALQPEDKSHEEAADTTLGFLVVPQGSLLYFGSETELSGLKSTLGCSRHKPITGKNLKSTASLKEA